MDGPDCGFFTILSGRTAGSSCTIETFSGWKVGCIGVEEEEDAEAFALLRAASKAASKAASSQSSHSSSIGPIGSLAEELTTCDVLRS